MSGRVFVCQEYRFCLFLRFWYLELFPTVWYFFNCSRQCGIFWIVPTVWYFLNCSDSVVFFELFRQCGIFLIVPTVWYFFNCSDSVVFFVFHFIVAKYLIKYALFWYCILIWHVTFNKTYSDSDINHILDILYSFPLTSD